MARVEPRKETIRRLFALSGNVCAFPGCNNHLINGRGRYVGNVCHIEAAEIEGERYNHNQNDEERRSFENLILLCRNHHAETNDEEVYSVEVLNEMKAKHEARFLNNQYAVSETILDKAIEDILKEIKQITERTEGNTEKLLAGQEEILTTLQNLSLSNYSQKDYLTREFENLKELKQNKNYSAVLKLLEKYKRDEWERLTPEQRYKIDLNIGLTHLELLEHKKAAIYLVSLPKYDVDIENSLSYAALGYSILGQEQDAASFINKTLALNPHNEIAILSLLISSTDTSMDGLELLVPKELINTPIITLNLALKAQYEEKYTVALKWIDKSFENVKEDSILFNELKAHKATILLKSKQDYFKDVQNQFSKEEKEMFIEAATLLQEAWDYFKDTELNRSRGYYLTNLSVVKKYLGKMDEAIVDAEASILLFQNYMSYRNLILLLFQNKAYDKALEVIERTERFVKKDKERGDLILLKVSIFEQKGLPTEAITILLHAFTDLRLDKASKGEVISKLIFNYLIVDNIQEASNYLEVLQVELPNHVSTLYMEAHIQKKLQNVDEFYKNLDRVYQRLIEVPSELNSVYFHYLAEDYGILNDFQKAKECYKHIVNPSVYNRITKAYLTCLFNAGDYGEIITIATSLKEVHPQKSFISEILFHVYYNNTSYEDALKHCNDVIKLNPTSSNFVLKRCFLYIKTGNKEEIKNDLETIQSTDGFSITETYQYAYLYLYIGESLKALEIAYHARIDNYQSPEAQSNYLAVITEEKEFETSFWIPEIAEVNTTVFIEGHGKKILAYTIVDYPPKAPDEIFNESDFAVKLIAKHVGDLIEVDSNNKYRIVKIYSKYKFALEDTIEILTTKFSTESGIKQFQFTEAKEVLNSMSETFEQNRTFFEQLDEQYSRGQLTIGCQATLTKRNVVDTWVHVLNKPSGLKCINSRIELIEEIKNAHTNVLTLSLESLLTINSLKIFDLVSTNFQLQIPQSCIDEIDLFIEEMKAIPEKGVLTFTKVGSEYFKNEFSKEAANNNVDTFETLKNDLLQRAIILPSQTSLEMNYHFKLEYDKVLGKCFVDSIVIAKETGTVLLSDDYANRCLAKNEFGVKGTEIFAVLAYLHYQKLIEDERFIALIVELITMNYKTIPIVQSQILIRLLDKSGYQLRFPFTNACEGLTGSILSDEQSCYAVVEFLRNLFLEESLNVIRDQVTILVLNSFFTGRNPSKAKKLVHSQLKLKFELLPVQYDAICSILKFF